MKQKKLIIFFPSIEKGGVEKNFFIILNFLTKKIKNVSVITSDPKKIKNKKIKIIKSNFFLSKKSRLIKNIDCIYLLIKELINDRNLTVLSFQANLFATLVSYIFKINIISRANASPIGWLNNPFKKFIYKSIMKLSSKIIVNSNEMKMEFKKKLNLNSTLIYNPLDKKKIIYKSKEKIKLNFFKNKKCLKIINIGRFTKQKDQITLLKALSLIKKKFKFKLILLGQGLEKNKLKNYIVSNNLKNKVKILNYRENPYPILKKSDLFILTSIYEGLPNVLLEAITLNKPIISSDCPTGPKEILQNGKAGTLFKTGDHFDLYKKIINFKKNKKKITLAKKYLARFDYHKNLNKYLKLLQI